MEFAYWLLLHALEAGKPVPLMNKNLGMGKKDDEEPDQQPDVSTGSPRGQVLKQM